MRTFRASKGREKPIVPILNALRMKPGEHYLRGSEVAPTVTIVCLPKY